MTSAIDQIVVALDTAAETMTPFLEQFEDTVRKAPSPAAMLTLVRTAREAFRPLLDAATRLRAPLAAFDARMAAHESNLTSGAKAGPRH